MRTLNFFKHVFFIQNDFLTFMTFDHIFELLGSDYSFVLIEILGKEIY